MRSTLCALVALLSCGAATARAQATPAQDVSITVRGFLRFGGSPPGWILVLPEPVALPGYRTSVLTVTGDPARWTRFRDRYVEVGGRASRPPGSPTAALALDRVHDAEPAGTVRRDIQPSLTRAARLIFSIVPSRFAWRTAEGQPTGVQPVLVYSIVNHGQTSLEFMLPSNELVCIAVTPEWGAAGWEHTTQAPAPTPQRIVIELGSVYRETVTIPEAAARAPGRYTVRATLCGVADYVMETEFEVR